MPKDQWRLAKTDQQLILLEGWFLGFQPKAAAIADSNLNEINDQLKRYEFLYSLFRSFLYIKPVDPQFTVKWRIEAEQNMRASGKSGMTDKQAEQYIRKFLPAYQMYRNSVEARKHEFDNFKLIEIAENRLPIQ